MISKKVMTLLNEQITHEFYAAFLYLSMAAQAEDMNLKGLANWFYVQHQEEHTHAMHIFEFLVERGHKVTLDQIKAPKTTWKTPLEMVKDALKHEKLVTSLFEKMMDIAHADKDYAAISFMNFYIDEQVEEEANATELITMFEAAETKASLFMVDAQLKTRTFTPSFPVKATPAQLA